MYPTKNKDKKNQKQRKTINDIIICFLIFPFLSQHYLCTAAY